MTGASILKAMRGGWTPFALLLLLATVILVAVHTFAGHQPKEPGPPEHRLEQLAPLEAPGGAVTAEGAGRQEDGQWTMPAGDYASTRYSALDQINTGNAARLQPVFTFETGIKRGHEAAPLVVGSTMYIVTPFPNTVFALDLTKSQSPLKWTYHAPVVPAAQGVACCDVVNRGAAFEGGRLFFNTLDGQTVALDAVNGREIWRTKLADINRGETMTMAPLVAEGKVVVGNSGGEFGVRGWLTALNAADGSVAWKAYATGPDADVLIGPEFRPFYPSEQGRDLGVTTWPPEAWRIGGGSGWGWVSYDPVRHLIYAGTGNPGPWNPEQRPGSNHWTAGLFARDVRTGQARWFYQSSPHDLYDHDDINETILLDMNVGGRMRPVLVRAGRTGFFYVIDRETGQVLSADPFTNVTSATGVDLTTGLLQAMPDKAPKAGRVTRNICPASPGGKDWNPAAFSPRTGLVYIPHNNLCMDLGLTETNYIAGTPYLGSDEKMYAGPGGNRGFFTAWDPVRRHAVWRVREDLPVWSGALVTAGDLVFYGTMDGWFKAVDARTGALLWQFHTESGIIGQPVSYRGPDGRQYIAILSGVGGWAGATVSNGIDPRDSTTALGFSNATGDLPGKVPPGGRLYVFAVPQ